MEVNIEESLVALESIDRILLCLKQTKLTKIRLSIDIRFTNTLKAVPEELIEFCLGHSCLSEFDQER